MWEIGGRWWGRLSLLVVFFALVGLGVAQIVSTTSNLYILTQGKKKLIVHNGHRPPLDWAFCILIVKPSDECILTLAVN